MKWVGVLNIKNNQFFLAGRLIAQSPNSFINYCLFTELPKYLIVFFINKPPTHFVNLIKQSLSAQNSVMYYRVSRFIYISLNTKQYIISIVSGVFISLIISLWMLSIADQYSDQAITLNSKNNIGKVLDWAKRQCLDNACISRLSIFPGELFFVEFTQSKKKLYGCKSVGERGMICKKESLFMVP